MQEEVRDMVIACKHVNKQLGNSWPDGVSLQIVFVTDQTKIKSTQRTVASQQHSPTPSQGSCFCIMIPKVPDKGNHKEKERI